MPAAATAPPCCLSWKDLRPHSLRRSAGHCLKTDCVGGIAAATTVPGCQCAIATHCRAKELNQLRKGSSPLMLPEEEGAAPGTQVGQVSR